MVVKQVTQRLVATTRRIGGDKPYCPLLLDNLADGSDKVGTIRGIRRLTDTGLKGAKALAEEHGPFRKKAGIKYKYPFNLTVGSMG